jgi:cell division protein FtsL
MEAIHGALLGVLVLWGAVTAVLIALLAYRGTLEIREDDQIFLDRAGDSMANEQRELVARIDKLSKPIKLFMILSIVLLLTALGVFLFEGFNKF